MWEKDGRVQTMLAPQNWVVQGSTKNDVNYKYEQKLFLMSKYA